MAGRTATLTIQILGDARRGQAAVEGLTGTLDRTEQKLDSLAVPAGVALAAITTMGVGAVNEASKVEQSFGALQSVFGDQAAAAEDMARRSAQSTGLATADYAQMAATLGAQLRNMGVAEKDLLPLTEDLIAQGADMAATFGGPTSDAVNAISSLLRGERDPIERYGVSIKDATIQAELAAQGLDDLTGQAKTNASTQATLALLTQQTAASQGAFAREADTAAGAQARAGAAWTNAAAALGEILLPVVVVGSTLLSDLAGVVTENAEVVQILVGVVGVLAGGILAANLAIKAYRAGLVILKAAQIAIQAATKAWTAVQWLLNAALNANPIGLVVLAIGALVGAFVLAYNKSETFRRIVDGVFRAVQKVVGDVVDFIVGLFARLGGILAKPFQSLVGIVRTVMRTITGIVEGAVGFISGILDGIGDTIGGIVDALPGGKTAPAAAAMTRGLLGAPVATAGATTPTFRARNRVSGSVTITHRIDDPNGALGRVPGGAAAVAAMLARGTESSGLYRNLQHAAGIR